MCNVKTSVVKSYEECRDSCQNCTAFTYRKDEKICDVHHSKACIDMMNALGIVHYIKRCNEKGKTILCSLLIISLFRTMMFIWLRFTVYIFSNTAPFKNVKNSYLIVGQKRCETTQMRN